MLVSLCFSEAFQILPARPAPVLCTETKLSAEREKNTPARQGELADVMRVRTLYLPFYHLTEVVTLVTFKLDRGRSREAIK